MLVFRPSKISGNDASAKNPKEVAGPVSCISYILLCTSCFVYSLRWLFQAYVADKATCVAVSCLKFSAPKTSLCTPFEFSCFQGPSFAKECPSAPSSFDDSDDEEELLRPSSALVAVFGLAVQEEQSTEPIPVEDVEVPYDPFDEASIYCKYIYIYITACSLIFSSSNSGIWAQAEWEPNIVLPNMDHHDPTWWMRDDRDDGDWFPAEKDILLIFIVNPTS